MIPYGRQFIDKNDIAAVVNVLKSDWLTQGPKVQEFEKALAKYCGSKYAVTVSSGTAALHLAYLTAGLKKGDEVITTPNTFAATTNMLLVVGAKPVFCDIRLDTYNIDEDKIEKLITKKTKAIVPVHFAGQPCRMDKILKIAKKHKLAVIEDACHALGAKYKNKKIGSIGNMTIFSFHPVKSITTGEGGAILTDNKNYYRKLLCLRSHGIHKDKNGFNVMTELGYNYRMTDIQAALGISQLKRMSRFLKLRANIAKQYSRKLYSVPNLILPGKTLKSISSWHLYVIRFSNKLIRNKILKELRKNKISTQIHYMPAYRHPFYQKLDRQKINCLNAEIFYKSALSIPIFPSLKKMDQNLIINNLKRLIYTYT